MKKSVLSLIIVGLLAYGCETGTEESTVPTGMVLVPAGSFMQGCNSLIDDDCYSEESPYHEVSVPGFYIDEYETTVADFAACVSAGACREPEGMDYSSYCNWGAKGRSNHPVNCIDWTQASAYCEWAGKRLCSESEWEKASRGTGGRKYPWGNETATCEYAVMDEYDEYEVMDEGGYGCGTGFTMAVGLKPLGVSPYGAYDMSGNVWEWVEDDWHSSYSQAPTNGNTWVDSQRASDRVVRGGGFGGNAFNQRSSHRDGLAVSARYGNLGARCCSSGLR